MLGTVAVDEVFGGATEDNLTRNADGRIVVETDRRFFLVLVVEDNGDASFGDTGLSTLVNEVLRRSGKLECRRLYAKKKTYWANFKLGGCVCSYLKVLRADCGHVGDA